MRQASRVQNVWAAILLSIVASVPASALADSQEFTDTFMLDQCKGFSTTGSNPFFVLQPGFQSVFEGVEGKQAVRLAITVLKQTRLIDGVQTRVVQERETHDGALVEISRNYFAVCNRNDSVFYFGEDTDLYESGVVVSHEGSWHSGSNGAKAGLVMPGIVLLGSAYQQELAPDVAMDRAEIVSLTETVATPGGVFEDAVETVESTPLEPNSTEPKWYAAGVGLIQDDTLQIVQYGFVTPSK